MILMVSINALTFAPEFYSFVVIYFILGSVSISTLMGAFVLGKHYNVALSQNIVLKQSMWVMFADHI